MQPLPPATLTNIFDAAGTAFRSAASQLDTPQASRLLLEGAHDLAQGAPSLNLTRDPAIRDLAASISDAAQAARSLASQLSIPSKINVPAVQQVVLGWARLADNASAAICPLPPLN